MEKHLKGDHSRVGRGRGRAGNGRRGRTPWQSRAEGGLGAAVGWHGYMSHPCPACDVWSKFQVAKNHKVGRLAAGVRSRLDSLFFSFFFPFSFFCSFFLDL